MHETQQPRDPKKTTGIVYAVILVVLLLLNFWAFPAMMKGQVKQVDYGTFLNMLEGGELSTVDYVDIVYEGYGVGGSAVIVQCLTDNKNRTAGDVRHLFDKFGGSMGTTGCVSFMFKRKGVITIAKEDIAEDDLMMYALEIDGFEDINSEDEDVFEVYADIAKLQSVREALEKDGVKVLSAEIDMIPDNYVTPTAEQQATIIKMIDKLEELDDVQNVYHNATLDVDDEE